MWGVTDIPLGMWTEITSDVKHTFTYPDDIWTVKIGLGLMLGLGLGLGLVMTVQILTVQITTDNLRYVNTSIACHVST